MERITENQFQRLKENLVELCHAGLIVKVLNTRGRMTPENLSFS